jgi:RimJ/RimL family protein N-acetyltransferase
MARVITFRPVAAADSGDLFDWRNDELTRSASVFQDEVQREEHDRWFSDSLESDRRTIYIAVDGESGESIGMCRFDSLGDRAEVSINLSPSWRGRGIAADVLGGAIGAYRESAVGALPLVATIRRENVASARIFEKAGFERTSADAGYDYFRLA